MNGGRNEDAAKRTTEGEIKEGAFFAKIFARKRKMILAPYASDCVGMQATCNTYRGGHTVDAGSRARDY